MLYYGSMRKKFAKTILVVVLVMLSMLCTSCITSGRHDVELQVLEEPVEQPEPSGEYEPLEDVEAGVVIEMEDDAQDEAIPMADAGDEPEITVGPADIGEIPVEAPSVPEPEPPKPDTEPITDPDAFVIGDVIVPKWFMYISSGLFLAMLMAICYISNQKRKALWYGRRD